MKCGPGTVELAFNSTNPAALAWAERHAAELVSQVGKDAKAAIRALVVQAFEDGVSPRDLARLIRETVGLTERDALAVVRRRADLLRGGATEAVAQAKAEKYAAKLLRSRALTIARTEAMRASNEGQEELWAEAQAHGFLTGREFKVWMGADPCPICAPYNGEKVLLNDTFSAGQDPPLHPNCMCTIGIVMS